MLRNITLSADEALIARARDKALAEMLTGFAACQHNRRLCTVLREYLCTALEYHEHRVCRCALGHDQAAGINLALSGVRCQLGSGGTVQVGEYRAGEEVLGQFLHGRYDAISICNRATRWIG